MVTNTFFHSMLSAGVETNCPQGGDAGHGGRTVITLDSQGQLDIEPIRVDAGGDFEAEALADALEWVGQELRRQIIANRDATPRG
jgi:hypothetical protein